MSAQTEGAVVDLDLENERAVLSAALRSQAAFERVAPVLRAEHFVKPSHATIWEAISAVNRQGTAADPVVVDVLLVADRLNETGQLGQIGGAPYLHDLVRQSVTPVNALTYARKIVASHRDREQHALGVRLAQAALQPKTAAERSGQLAEAIQTLESLTADNGAVDPAPMLSVELPAVLDSLDGVVAPGLSTGLADLDDVLGGMSPGDLIVVGARPSIGKTVVGEHVALHVAKELHRGAMIFSLEMPRSQMLARVMATVCRINSRRLNLRRPSLTDDDWGRIANKLPELTEMPLWCYAEPSLDPAKFSALVGARKRKNPDLALVVVDYAQLMQAGVSTQSREQEVAYIVRELKKAAIRLQVVIVLLAQLNRGPEQRADKRPQLSDMRESGGIEQDADVVILLHREDFYEPESPRAGEMDLIVAKNRHGPTQTVTVAAQLHLYRIGNFAEQPSA